MTLSIMTLSIMTLSIMTLSIMTLSIMAISMTLTNVKHSIMNISTVMLTPLNKISVMLSDTFLCVKYLQFKCLILFLH